MNSDWLDIELLEDYLDGKLDASAMHQVEKQALEDPFVAQALAGLSESPRRKESVSLLQKQLYERIAQQQVQKKETVFTWQRLSVAAAAAVMFISVSILFFLRDNNSREQQSTSRPKNVEVNIAPLSTDTTKNEAYVATIPATTDVREATKNKTENNKVITVVQDAPMVTTVATDSATVTADEENKPVSAAARVVTALAPSVSSPLGGWANFDTYLNDNNKLIPAAGKLGKLVEVSFMVDAEGKPADIKVVKGAEKEFDDEAIRLIKDGPKWEIPKSAESRVTYTIAF